MLDNASPEGQDNKTEWDAGNSNPASSAVRSTEADQEPSLGDDLSALIDDGKAYVEAELTFQKSRASFAGQEAKAGIGFALAMFALLHLALIGIVVGLILALGPIVGFFPATGIVVGVLLLCTALFGWLAVRRFKGISRAFDNKKLETSTGDTA